MFCCELGIGQPSRPIDDSSLIGDDAVFLKERSLCSIETFRDSPNNLVSGDSLPNQSGEGNANKGIPDQAGCSGGRQRVASIKTSLFLRLSKGMSLDIGSLAYGQLTLARHKFP